MPTETTSAVRQLSDGNPIGTALGRDATDKIGFFTSSTDGPVVQPSGSQQAALPANGTTTSGGFLTIYRSTQSPASVAANTTAEEALTVTGLLATDLVIVNKPTAQAGLGLCSCRVSAANALRITFLNTTAADVTPTSSQAYLVASIPAALQLSATLSPASVAANSCVEQTFTVVGLQPGMAVQVNKPTLQAGLAVLTARCSEADTLAITFANVTAAAITPTADEAYIVAGLNAIMSGSPAVVHGANVGTLSGVATVTTSEQSLTVAGIAAADILVGMVKPALQAGLGLLTGRISAANTVQITFANVTGGTLTPTASEVYQITVLQSVAVAPLVLFTSAELTPGSVAADTTTEQTFTVTGLVSGQPVLVSPNFQQTNGIGIAGVRASGTDTLAINFLNTTSGAITPAAGTYTVAMFGQTIPTAGNYVKQFVSVGTRLGDTLLNGTREALVSLGLMAGE